MEKLKWLEADPTPEQAKAWIRHLFLDLGLNFHPDVPAADYLDSAGCQFFSDEDANIYDEGVTTLFAQFGDVVYTQALHVFRGLLTAPSDN